MMDETEDFNRGSSYRRIGDGTTLPLRLRVMPDDWTIELAKPAVVVGRHTDVELRLAYPDVSRRHCRLSFADGLWRVRDLDSLNGLFVNGERIHEATLTEGDELQIGEATLIVTEAPAALGAGADVLRSIAEALPG
jgi:pSer/pThr/pTyr-binding forkhead associated (FHA) protein